MCLGVWSHLQSKNYDITQHCHLVWDDLRQKTSHSESRSDLKGTGTSETCSLHNYLSTVKMVSTRWQHLSKPCVTAAFGAFRRYENVWWREKWEPFRKIRDPCTLKGFFHSLVFGWVYLPTSQTYLWEMQNKGPLKMFYVTWTEISELLLFIHWQNIL